MADNALITRYRPTSWSEVVGQKKIVASLRASVEEDRSHSYLLIGPSGTGKTTLARIAAKAIGAADANDIIEVNAATYTGIDDMRSLTEGFRVRPLSKSDVKAVILDEAQRLSPQAFDSILKDIEEPPEWLYWFLCTTNASRIPKTIQTRCTTYTLQPVSVNDLWELLAGIADKEKFVVDDDVLTVCAKQAGGSPRQALVNLAVCAEAEDRREAAELLRAADATPEPIKLIQALVTGKKWNVIQPILEGMADADPESVRHMTRAYITKVIVGTTDPRKAAEMFSILDAFSQPFNAADGISPVVLAVGRVLFGGGS